MLLSAAIVPPLSIVQAMLDWHRISRRLMENARRRQLQQDTIRVMNCS